MRDRPADLADEHIHKEFWKSGQSSDDSLSDFAHTCTSPHVECSSLVAMGFSDDEAQAIIKGAIKYRIICKGCSHVVLELRRARGIGLREAGLLLAAGDESAWTEAAARYPELCEEIIPQ